METGATVVIEIKNGEVVAVTSTDHNLQYVVFNHDTRNQKLDAYQPDLCMNYEDLQAHIRSLMDGNEPKPQVHIKSFCCFSDDSVESTFELPDGDKLTLKLTSEAMAGKSMHDKYTAMLAKIDRHRKCSQLEMDSATS